MKNTSIVFTGDIGFDKFMDRKWEDEGLLSEEVLHFLHSGNHVLANVEGPVSDMEKKPGQTSVLSLLHTINPKAMSVLSSMQADIWNLNNNHIMDAGEEGLFDTLALAKKTGIKTIGAGMNIEDAARPIILDEAGGIGIFSVGYRRGCKPASEEKGGCLNWTELDIIQKNIDEIKRKCCWCVIVSHGGEEFTSLPMPYTRDRYLKFLEMGADIIVCHHPHVPMNYETFPGKAIFYSLGNFIFDTPYQRAQFDTEKGVVLKINFSEDNFSFDAMGIKINRENEHIEKGELPKIFCDVQAGEYEKLLPLAAKAFVSATKRQVRFLKPDEYTDATEEKWRENFYDPKRSGRVEGEALDFYIVCPLAEKEALGEWKKSGLTDVKDYILEQV